MSFGADFKEFGIWLVQESTDSIANSVDRSLVSSVNCALPNYTDPPLHCLKLLCDGAISPFIADEFGSPKIRPRSRECCFRAAVMMVPETSVYEDDNFLLYKDDVRSAWKISSVQPETQTGRMKRRTQHSLWFGVGACNPAHIKPSLRRGEYIHHGILSTFLHWQYGPLFSTGDKVQSEGTASIAEFDPSAIAPGKARFSAPRKNIWRRTWPF
jgi:hypothetical protein